MLLTYYTKWMKGRQCAVVCCGFSVLSSPEESLINGIKLVNRTSPVGLYIQYSKLPLEPFPFLSAPQRQNLADRGSYRRLAQLRWMRGGRRGRICTVIEAGNSTLSFPFSFGTLSLSISTTEAKN
jgi:hypothetical protein